MPPINTHAIDSPTPIIIQRAGMNEITGDLRVVLIWWDAGYGHLQYSFRACKASAPGQQPGSSARHAWALLAGRLRHGHLKRSCPPPACCLKALKAHVGKFTATHASGHLHNTVTVGSVDYCLERA